MTPVKVVLPPGGSAWPDPAWIDRAAEQEAPASSGLTSTAVAACSNEVIDGSTTLPEFQKTVRWNQAYYRLAQGF